MAKLKELEMAHKIIQQALETKRTEGYEKELLKIINDYADTWFLLNLYDKEKLVIEDVSLKSGVRLDYDKVIKKYRAFSRAPDVAKTSNRFIWR